MKKFLLSIGLALSLFGVADAKTPPEVIKPYKAYTTALKAQDMKAARKHAYEAWQKAEELMGDTKTTGDLAQNYADVETSKDVTDYKSRAKAYERSMELTVDYGLDATYVYMDRGIKLSNLSRAAGKKSKGTATAKQLVKYAKENDFVNSTFYGEALTLLATHYADTGNSKQMKRYADEALKAFESRSDGIVSAYPIIANLYKGYGHEAEDESVEAALSYQKVMESIDGVEPTEHPLAAQALGRWSHMRSRLYSEGNLEDAEEQGLCRCWPYDKPRNENIKPIERVPPRMPSKAARVGVSGYTIVEFDLSDEGGVINPEILVSWPEGFYEKSSLKALEEWKYSEKVEGETPSDRQDLIVTLRYVLSDRSGNPIY